MACCRDVRAVFFHRQFNSTVRHNQNFVSWLLAYIVAMVTALAGEQFIHYFMALFLLGLGWNFLYVGGSTLVATVATSEERGRVQGVADLATTSLVAMASLTAGGLHSQFGWDVLILAGCSHRYFGMWFGLVGGASTAHHRKPVLTCSSF